MGKPRTCSCKNKLARPKIKTGRVHGRQRGLNRNFSNVFKEPVRDYGSPKKPNPRRTKNQRGNKSAGSNIQELKTEIKYQRQKYDVEFVKKMLDYSDEIELGTHRGHNWRHVYDDEETRTKTQQSREHPPSEYSKSSGEHGKSAFITKDEQVKFLLAGLLNEETKRSFERANEDIKKNDYSKRVHDLRYSVSWYSPLLDNKSIPIFAGHWYNGELREIFRPTGLTLQYTNVRLSSMRTVSGNHDCPGIEACSNKGCKAKKVFYSGDGSNGKYFFAISCYPFGSDHCCYKKVPAYNSENPQFEKADVVIFPPNGGSARRK